MVYLTGKPLLIWYRYHASYDECKEKTNLITTLKKKKTKIWWNSLLLLTIYFEKNLPHFRSVAWVVSPDLRIIKSNNLCVNRYGRYWTWFWWRSFRSQCPTAGPRSFTIAQNYSCFSYLSHQDRAQRGSSHSEEEQPRRKFTEKVCSLFPMRLCVFPLVSYECQGLIL